MLKPIFLVFLLFYASAQLTGCSSNKGLYYWGRYERLIYDQYANPGSSDRTTQIAMLTEDIGRAEAEGQKVPPGVHAHLGYLYYQQGNVDSAIKEFSIEKDLFPEAKVLMDRFLQKM
ncbi:MAG: DUF4810 domain-containing protein [Methylococcaceae bacterium]